MGDIASNGRRLHANPTRTQWQNALLTSYNSSPVLGTSHSNSKLFVPNCPPKNETAVLEGLRVPYMCPIRGTERGSRER